MSFKFGDKASGQRDIFGFPVGINLHLLMIISCVNIFGICLLLFEESGNKYALMQISLVMCCSIIIRSNKKISLESYQLRADNKGLYRFFDSLFNLTIFMLVFLAMAFTVQILISSIG